MPFCLHHSSIPMSCGAGVLTIRFQAPPLPCQADSTNTNAGRKCVSWVMQRSGSRGRYTHSGAKLAAVNSSMMPAIRGLPVFQPDSTKTWRLPRIRFRSRLCGPRVCSSCCKAVWAACWFCPRSAVFCNAHKRAVSLPSPAADCSRAIAEFRRPKRSSSRAAWIRPLRVSLTCMM